MPTGAVVDQPRSTEVRLDEPLEYLRYNGRFVINREIADSLQGDSIIMHPLPRVDELLSEVDESPHAVYLKQAGYGVAA